MAKPTFTDCPDDKPEHLLRYERLDIAVPTATDNTGIKTIDVSPYIGTPVTEDVNVTFTAIDFNKNLVTCIVNVYVSGKCSI